MACFCILRSCGRKDESRGSSSLCQRGWTSVLLAEAARCRFRRVGSTVGSGLTGLRRSKAGCRAFSRRVRNGTTQVDNLVATTDDDSTEARYKREIRPRPRRRSTPCLLPPRHVRQTDVRHDRRRPLEAWSLAEFAMRTARRVVRLCLGLGEVAERERIFRHRRRARRLVLLLVFASTLLLARALLAQRDLRRRVLPEKRVQRVLLPVSTSFCFVALGRGRARTLARRVELLADLGRWRSALDASRQPGLLRVELVLLVLLLLDSFVGLVNLGRLRLALRARLLRLLVRRGLLDGC